jgi:arylsulfatase A-like enzyme
MNAAPNVVILMVDEQKANSLPLYGNPVVRTPNLARLAEEGVLFDQAYATCPLCVPARVSLMTGRYPHTTGSRTNAFLLQPGERHLLQIFLERGYRTGLSGKNHCFFPGDLARFDYLWEAGHAGPRVPPSREAAAAQRWIRESRVGARAWGAARNPYPPEALGTALITDHAIEFVERYRDEPFFLWYSIADPHTPLQTASPYAEMYRPEDVPLPPQLEGEIEAKPPAQQIDYRALAGDTVTEEIMRRAIAMYYGMNTYIDDQVGRFVARLTELGLRENTIVVYLADHGDYMGEHRMVRKSKALYDCLCRIPLIVSWPAGIAAGATRDEFVCIEDILPSLMDLLGWVAPTGTPTGVQGQSFAPLLRGGTYAAREAIFGEAGLEGRPYALDECTVFPEGPLTPDFTPRNKKGGRGRCKSVRTRRWKLVHYPGQPYGELYDLEADPWELVNLYGQSGYQDVVARLRALLLDWEIESEDTLPAPPAGKDIVDG